MAQMGGKLQVIMAQMGCKVEVIMAPKGINAQGNHGIDGKQGVCNPGKHGR
jgi:hypothetical protein